jgi:hypothetical protein
MEEYSKKILVKTDHKRKQSDKEDSVGNEEVVAVAKALQRKRDKKLLAKDK